MNAKLKSEVESVGLNLIETRVGADTGKSIFAIQYNWSFLLACTSDKHPHWESNFQITETTWWYLKGRSVSWANAVLNAIELPQHAFDTTQEYEKGVMFRDRAMDKIVQAILMNRLQVLLGILEPCSTP